MKFSGIIFSIIGVVVLGLGGYLYVREQLFLQEAEQSMSTVIDNQYYTYTGQVNEYGVQHYYCSVYAFQTRDGQSLSYEEPDAGLCAELDSPPNFQVGDQVNLYYDPTDPIGTLQTPKDVKLHKSGSVIVMVVGILFVVFGLGSFLTHWMRSRKTRRR